MPDNVFIYPATGSAYSMKRYCQGLVYGLSEKDIPYELVTPKDSANRFLRLMRKYISYPFLTLIKGRLPGTHIIISERFSFLLLFISSANTIVICHDLHTLHEEQRAAKRHKVYYKWLLGLMRRASKIVCVSQYTLNELKAHMPSLVESSMVVIHNAIEPIWYEAIEKMNVDGQVASPFSKGRVLLSIGTDSWYKNFPTTLKILKSLPLDYHLVKVGELDETSRQLINELGLRDRITHFNFISDHELLFTYQNAHCLIFPSLSEGFGWPALEAMAAGCPVVTSGKGGIHEFGLDAVLYADQLETYIEEVLKLNDTSVREELVDKGRTYAKAYTWSRVVDELLVV